MTGRARGRSARAASRRAAGSTSPSSRRVTRQQNINIDPNLSGESTVPATQDEFHTPAPARSILASIEEQATPSQKLVRVKLMKKFLDRLFTSSDDLYTHLLSPRDETWQDEYEGLSDAASAFRKHYVVDADAPFIDPNYVLTKIEAEPNSPLWTAASKTIGATNLTQLMGDLIEIQQGHTIDFVGELQTWDTVFPTFFVPDKEFIGPEDTFEQALQIRTQLFIVTLQSLYEQGHTETDPLDELAKIFCVAKDTATDELQAAMEDDESTVEFKPVLGFDLSADSQDRLRLIFRVRAIAKNLLSLGDLQAEFPFDVFVKNFLAYVQSAYVHTKDSLHLHGAVPTTPAIFEVATQSQIASQLEADAAMARPRHTYDPSFHGSVPPSAQPLSSYPPPENHYPQGTAPMYNVAEAAAAIVAGQKRAAPHDGDEDAFETDTRTPQNKRKGPGRPRTKRARKSLASDVEANATSDAVAPVAQMSIFDSEMGPDLIALSQKVKEVAAENRKPKEPQTRTPWSQQDTKLLIRAVDIFKCKWSSIAKEIVTGRIPFQHPRNQQALRDKARILKQDYLRTDGILPPSFDLVVLGKKEIENVKSVGRNPFRKEADIVDGRPVNTLLQLALVDPEMMHADTSQQEPLELLQQEEHMPPPESAVQHDPELQSLSAEVIPPEPVHQEPEALTA